LPPGSWAGTMAMNGNCRPTGTVAFEVNPPASIAGTDFDQYVINGTLDLSGASLSFTGSAGAVAANQLVKLIDNDGSDVTAPASNFADGAMLTINGNNYQILYAGADGNDVVLEANNAPTDIALSGTSVAENQPSGTTVGTLSTTDPDSGDSHTYSLVSGPGDTDNASFTIVGNELKTAASFNFEAQSSYS